MHACAGCELSVLTIFGKGGLILVAKIGPGESVFCQNWSGPRNYFGGTNFDMMAYSVK